MDALSVFALTLWSFALLASVLDLRSQRIPDAVNYGGIAAGCAVSWFAGKSLWFSPVGAIGGAACLAVLAFIGRKVFGRREHRFDPPEEFTIEKLDGQLDRKLVLRSGGCTDPWKDFFGSVSDKVELVCAQWSNPTLNAQDDVLVCTRDRFRSLRLGRFVRFEDGPVTGIWRTLRFRADVLGWGDVKLAAALGTFLGAGIFGALFVAGVVGIIIGGLLRARGVREFPFGPALATGALVWYYWGGAVSAWYLQKFWHVT